MTFHTAIFQHADTLPLDGQCVCVECKGRDFNRSQMSFYDLSALCETCLPLWTYGSRKPSCSCGHDVINHNGQRGFVECYECRNEPRVISFTDLIEVAKPLPDNDAFYDLVEPYERKYGLGGIYDLRQHSQDAQRDHSIDGAAL